MVQEAERHASDDEPFSALAFKDHDRPICRKIDISSVYTPVLQKQEVMYLNSTKDKKERFGRMVQMHANSS